MGLNDYWEQQSRKASKFLESGKFSDVVRNSPINPKLYARGQDKDESFQTLNGCVSSRQCPSGYACVNGICTQMNRASGAGGEQWPTPGPCEPDVPESPCNTAGPNSCQTGPNCGNDSNRPVDDCCGRRCCSFGSASSQRPGVHCFCGKCPPYPKECNQFCAGYLAANGEVGPGCTEGQDGNSCSACETCNNGKCVEKFNAPCFCGENNCTGDCEKCNQDEDSPNYGECEVDEDDCQNCTTITNYLCPCNKILAPFTVCKSVKEGGLVSASLAQLQARNKCEKLCKKEPDPCIPKCEYKTRCSDTGGGDATCLSGEKQVGYIDAGGKTCVICRIGCEDLPDSCKDCDCNCENDCGDCEICNNEGKCVTDPKCDKCPPEKTFCIQGTSQDFNDGGLCCPEGQTCVEVWVSTWETNSDGDTADYVTLGPPIYSYVAGGEGGCPCRGCRGQTVDCADARPMLRLQNSVSTVQIGNCVHASRTKNGRVRCILFGEDGKTCDGKFRPYNPPKLLSMHMWRTACCDENEIGNYPYG